MLKDDDLFDVKKKEETINKTLRIPVDILKELEVLAQDKNISFNQIVIKCCEYALDHLKK